MLRQPASVEEHSEVMETTYDRRLWWLTRTHVVFGVVAAVLAPIRIRNHLVLARIFPPSGLEQILVVPLFALTLGQAVLLAVWAVGSAQSPWKRLAGLVAGAIFLEALLAFCLKDEFLGIAIVTIVVTTTSLLVVRIFGIRLVREAETGQDGQSEAKGLRFSIRDLMLLIAAVALLSTGTRVFRSSHGHILLAAVWALCFVAVGLVALWSALGEGRPLRRMPVVFLLSPVLGAFFAHSADAHEAGWLYILLTMLLYPAALLGSLLVVRSCGYRLVGRVPYSS